jgi:hypothetical protein
MGSHNYGGNDDHEKHEEGNERGGIMQKRTIRATNAIE